MTENNKVDDGGYVYPEVQDFVGVEGDMHIRWRMGRGITRRDDLAKVAMQGIIRSQAELNVGDFYYSEIVARAYALADAMIAEGRKGE